jgi:8-oxo-dGTP pyrophosphatase MutT (NUDIX family)
VRDGAAGLEVYLLRRVAAMSFAPGAYVYPGGSVDADDRDAEIGWAGATPAQWAATFGTDEPTALSLVCAAVRETFEESGVLLAGTGAGQVLPDVSGDEWEAERETLEARGQSLSQLLARRGLVLRATCCGRWRTGSRPRPSPGASTRGSSSPRCPRGSSAATSAARPTAGSGSARARRSTRASC